MVITRISDYGVRINQGSLTLAINPAVKKANIVGGTTSAEIVLLSAPHAGFDSAEHFTTKGKENFVIQYPGEYEKEEMFIYGEASTTMFGGNKSPNTVYYFNLDNMDVLVLGAHESAELPKAVTELVDNVDILILPVTGDEVLGAVPAQKLATKLEAKVVIPMGSTDQKDPGIEAFKNELSHDMEVVDKISLRSTDLTEKPKAYFLT